MKLDSLLAQIGKNEAQKIPPVEKWNPPLSGDIDIEIQKDGSWWHEGELIQRQELVNIFASILKCEQDEYFLVTPVEKWRIRVADKPLHISMVEQDGEQIKVLTSTADSFSIDGDHPLQMSQLDDTEIAEVKVRNNLWARFTRNAWYTLLQFSTQNDKGQIIINSNGRTFVLANGV